jgi:hypothetical protein
MGTPTVVRLAVLGRGRDMVTEPWQLVVNRGEFASVESK